MRKTTAWLVCAMSLPCLSGCGADHTARKMELAKFALEYHEFNAAHGAAPARLDDLKERSSAFPNVYTQIEDGRLVVIWNAKLSHDGNENENYVLAYEKTVPEKGGWVIRAGGSVRRMTAEEFQKLPKIEQAAE